MTDTTHTTHTPGTPPSPLAARMWRRASAQWEQEQFDAAAQSCANVLALDPTHTDALRMLGSIAQQRGDAATAIDCFQRAMAIGPDDAGLRINLGIALYERGDSDAALTHLRRATELVPDNPAAWFNLGSALTKHAMTDPAIQAFRRTLALQPGHLRAALALARAQVAAGRIEAAIAGYRDVLRRAPANAQAWFGLANLNTLRFDAADTAALKAAYASPAMSAEDRELLGSAYGKALEHQGDYAQAFDTFRQVKESQRRLVTGSAAGERERVALLRHCFTPALPAPADPRQGREVIFIISLPRSGSSLVEQILASHREVEGANEIPDLLHVIDAEGERRAATFPGWVADATAADWQRLGRDYLARTARWRVHKPRFTDKHLANWHFVGAALTMLPAARIVVVRRDPVEACLACYRQYFTAMVGYACDLDDMADYYASFLHLTRFWRERFPERVFDLQYETLIAEPEPTIRRLLAFCSLPFDPACLEFYKTPRAVMSTPSAAQVRQPLRRDTARSALYGNKLDGLRRRLRDAGVLED